MTRLLILAVLTISLTACAKHESNRGYMFENADFTKVVIGKSSKQEVEQFLGSPSSKSNFGPETFFYIGSKLERYGFLNPVVVEQRVVALEFSQNGLLKAVREFDTDDYKVIDNLDKQTDLKGNTLTPLEQIMSNIGKFNKNTGKANR